MNPDTTVKNVILRELLVKFSDRWARVAGLIFHSFWVEKIINAFRVFLVKLADRNTFGRFLVWCFKGNNEWYSPVGLSLFLWIK
ncbi:hypothetical protein D3C87_1776510 [compost metagenome]